MAGSLLYSNFGLVAWYQLFGQQETVVTGWHMHICRAENAHVTLNSISFLPHSLSLRYTLTFTSCESPSVDPTNTTRLSRYARHEGAAVCRSKTDVTLSTYAQLPGSCDHHVKQLGQVGKLLWHNQQRPLLLLGPILKKKFNEVQML